MVFSSRMVAWLWLCPNGFAVQTLVEYHANAPYVDFGGNFRWSFTNYKTFRRKVPISPGTLARKVHALLWVVVIIVHYLGQTKISYLNVTRNGISATREQDVSRLEIVVDDGRFYLVEILQGRDNLHYDTP